MQNKKRLLLLHLSLIEGVGDARIQLLLERVPDDVSLYDIDQPTLERYGITSQVAARVVAGLADTTMLEREVELIIKHAIQWVTLVDDAYPALLRTIHCPPAVLYMMGEPLASMRKAIAFVGSRKAGVYAQQVIEHLVPPLIQRSWTIVSGGALGADTLAHRAAVAAGGRTVAVIGAGLLEPYPSSNQPLFRAIVDQGGTVVSPFALKQKAQQYHFPARNRIIAGLSQATVVVQAARKSGARITALYALEQGRHVFTVPGSIFDELSHGCHALIKEGATAILDSDDLLIELGEQVPVTTHKVALQQDTEAQVVVQEQTMGKQVSVDEPSEHASLADRILFHCRKQAVSLDELMQLLNADLHLMHEELFSLQLAGKLEQQLTGMYRAF